MPRSAPKRRPPAAPKPDWVVFAVAGIGMVLAGYLAILRLMGGTAVFCETGSACDVVQGSRYGEFLGLPTAAWGAFLYAAVAVLAALRVSAQRWTFLYALAVAGAAFSAYLTYLEVFVLRALCPYCLAAAGLSVVLLVLVVLRRPHGAGRRPARLAVGGVAIAIITIVVGAGVHVGAASPERAVYQQALARHLNDTGAVMYGAYW